MNTPTRNELIGHGDMAAPKFIMFYMFPIDSILKDKKATVATVDRSNICLPRDPDTARRLLPLFHHVPPGEIVNDLKEMNLTGLACVGVDGTCIAIADIKSERYTDLIHKCHEAGLLFIHSFPFADTYHCDLTKKFPHIKQKDFAGNHPFVGWDQVNGHFTIDYGSDEFVDFCKESIAALRELGVKVIDYGEPDHYPVPDNGYGESLVKAWTDQTGQNAPHPTTLAYRRFMEERNLRGVREIGDYARRFGMSDHLTASPLCHGSSLICQNYGRYSQSDIVQLSTTYHTPFSYIVAQTMDRVYQMRIPPAQADGIGCIESKSMRGWNERHAVYFGVGQGYPLERNQDLLNTAVLLYQMDLFLWDYTNFRNQSMYIYNRFEDPQAKFHELKRMVHSTIDAYWKLPQAYRQAVVSPDALVFYAKESDYERLVDQDRSHPDGWASLYAIAFRLQAADIPFMMAFDEYPQVLQHHGRDVPLLIIDGDQQLSAEFGAATTQWFGKNKIVFCGGALGAQHKSLLQKLNGRIEQSVAIEPATIDCLRNADYASATSSIPTDGWRILLTWQSKPIVFVKGTPSSGLLVYSVVPIHRLAREDLQKVCDLALQQVCAPRYHISCLFERELVRYRGSHATFLAVKNHSGETGVLTLKTISEPTAVYPRGDEFQIAKDTDGYKLEMNFRPREVRIVELINP